MKITYIIMYGTLMILNLLCTFLNVPSFTFHFHIVNLITFLFMVVIAFKIKWNTFPKNFRF